MLWKSLNMLPLSKIIRITFQNGAKIFQHIDTFKGYAMLQSNKQCLKVNGWIFCIMYSAASEQQLPNF